jgi:hypothetical protein
MATGYSNQLKTKTQDDSESPQEFSAVIKQMTHGASRTPHEDHVHTGASKAFIDGIRERLILKLRCNKRSTTYTQKPIPPLLKRRPHFTTRTYLRENTNLDHGFEAKNECAGKGQQ